MALDRATVVRKADALAREGRLDLAIAEYRALVVENPGDGSAANTLGDLYAQHGEITLAIEQFCSLGESEWLQGFSAKAAAFYKKALKVDPDCEGALARLGEIAAAQSLHVDATRHWKRLLEVRRSRGDAAGEAEVAGWLADLVNARSTPRQAISVGMTLRTPTRPAEASPDAVPVLLAEGVVEEPDTVPGLAGVGLDPSHAAERGAGEFAGEAAAAGEELHGAASAADDWEIVVELMDEEVEKPAAIERRTPVAATTVAPSPGADEAGGEGGDPALIAELVAAADTPSLRFQAAVQLGRIFLRRGDLSLGIEWLERACGAIAPVRDHGLAARYDLADALERGGHPQRALEVWSDLEMDAGSYRDVSARMMRLSRAVGQAP